MRILVDRKLCTLHGQCTLVAPDLFQFADGIAVIPVYGALVK